MVPDYPDVLARANSLPPGRWVISDGMGYGHTLKWWACESDDSDRGHVHNGIDLREYRTDEGEFIYAGASLKVPVARDGEVLRIVRDFLGHSVFVHHGCRQGGRVLLTAYGHIVPEPALRPGASLKQGGLLGRVAPYNGMPADKASSSNMTVPAHLHFSVIEVDNSFDLASVDWPALEEALDSATFMNPLNPIHPLEGD